MTLSHISENVLRTEIGRALKKHKRHLSKACKEVGLSRPTFLKHARHLGLWPKDTTKVWDYKRAA